MRILFLCLLLTGFAHAGDPVVAQNNIAEFKTPEGSVYMSVLLRHDRDRELAYALITRKLPAPPILFTDVKFELLDAAGDPVPTSPVPTEAALVETPHPLGGTANALYLATPADGQEPVSARLTWQGLTAEFPEIKVWDQ